MMKKNYAAKLSRVGGAVLFAAATWALSIPQALGQVLIEEDFTGQVLPAGWTNVVNPGGEPGQVWQFNNPGGRDLSNPTAAHFDSDFAIFDSSNYGSGSSQDGTMTSPSFDASNGTIFLDFDNSFRFYAVETGSVDVWNGTTWTTVLLLDENDGYPQPNHKRINITAAAGGSPVAQVRFHFTATWDYWWAIDNIKIEQFACAPAQATFAVVPDCGNDSFSVDVNITDFGSATTIDIKEGTTTLATASATGSYTVGPFGGGTSHQLTLVPSDDIQGYCSVTSDPLTYVCPLVINDNCDGALSLPINPDTAWTAFVHDSTVEAGASGVNSACGNAPNDVWYSFVAQDSIHVLDVRNLESADMLMVGAAVYEGSCSGGLSEIYCNGSMEMTGYPYPAATIDSLVIGQTYYVQIWTVFSMGSNDARYDIGVTSIPAAPNDKCVDAIDISNGSVVAGHNYRATHSMAPASCGVPNNEAKDVWYSLQAASDGDATVTVTSTDGDFALSAYKGQCGSLIEEACANAVTGPGTETINLTGVTAGDIYYVRIYALSDTYEGYFNVQASGTVLPVTMSALEGKVSTGNRAQLTWTTFEETNNRGFEVQRSEDGKVFRTVGFVSSLAENGYSRSRLSYHYEDAQALSQSTYYRLRQLDHDGRTSLSNILSLSPSKSAVFAVQVYPNPVNSGALTLSFTGERSGSGQVVISNVVGKEVTTIPVHEDEVTISVADLPAGMYWLQYSDKLHTQTVKVVVK